MTPIPGQNCKIALGHVNVASGDKRRCGDAFSKNHIGICYARRMIGKRVACVLEVNFGQCVSQSMVVRGP